MKAAVYDRYGPPGVLRIEEVARPAPRDDELLVRVRATTVNRLDCHTREANRSNGLVISGVSRLVSGIRRPRHLLDAEHPGRPVAVVDDGFHINRKSGMVRARRYRRRSGSPGCPRFCARRVQQRSTALSAPLWFTGADGVAEAIAPH